MRFTLATSFFALSIGGILGPLSPVQPYAVAQENQAAEFQPSKAALETAVRDIKGEPVTLAAYEDWDAAVRAGDMSAFVQFMARNAEEDRIAPALRALTLAVDAMADGDLDVARERIEAAREDAPESPIIDYTEAWLLAFEGDGEAAVKTHRSVSSDLPGLTGDLSLAALLESLGRTDEALAVYTALTPGEIDAPEHFFDPRSLVFSHVQTVIARRTLLLRRLGRIEEAKDVYRRLAEAQPEEAVRFAAALEALETGKGLDDEVLTPRTGFSRSILDLSLAIYQERIIRASFAGRRITGFDQSKSALDQLALLLTPEDEDARSIVVSGLHREALFEGASHVALSAPEDTPDLLMSAASALLLEQDQQAAQLALDRSLELIADDENRLGLSIRAARLFMLLEDQETTLRLTGEALETAENAAEKAAANAATATVLQHFGRYDDALAFAREAARLDDTHDRRVFHAMALGDVDQIDEALRILRTERLERPNDPYMLNSLGYFLITRTDKIEEGYRLLARAQSLQPNDPYIGDSLGWARYKFGDIEGALWLVERARDELLPHRHWEIEDHLGDLYWLLDRKVDAKEAWEVALAHYPPAKVKADLEAKLSGEHEPTRPEERELPDITEDDRGEVGKRDI